jgi:hypothetical protein
MGFWNAGGALALLLKSGAILIRTGSLKVFTAHREPEPERSPNPPPLHGYKEIPRKGAHHSRKEC